MIETVKNAQLKKNIAKCEKRIILLRKALQQYINIIQTDISVSLNVIQTIDELARLTTLKEAYVGELQRM